MSMFSLLIIPALLGIWNLLAHIDPEARDIIESARYREAKGSQTFNAPDTLGMVANKQIPIPAISVRQPSRYQENLLIGRNNLFVDGVQQVSYLDKNPDLYNIYLKNPQVHTQLKYELFRNGNEYLFVRKG